MRQRRLRRSRRADSVLTISQLFRTRFLSEYHPKTDGATGALTQTIRLDIPPGRNGVQPDLALKYNSQNAQDGIVGYGWTISIPYIQRLNKTGRKTSIAPAIHTLRLRSMANLQQHRQRRFRMARKSTTQLQRVFVL